MKTTKEIKYRRLGLYTDKNGAINFDQFDRCHDNERIIELNNIIRNEVSRERFVPDSPEDLLHQEMYPESYANFGAFVDISGPAHEMMVAAIQAETNKCKWIRGFNRLSYLENIVDAKEDDIVLLRNPAVLSGYRGNNIMPKLAVMAMHTANKEADTHTAVTSIHPDDKSGRKLFLDKLGFDIVKKTKYAGFDRLLLKKNYAEYKDI